MQAAQFNLRVSKTGDGGIVPSSSLATSDTRLKAMRYRGTIPVRLRTSHKQRLLGFGHTNRRQVDERFGKAAREEGQT